MRSSILFFILLVGCGGESFTTAAAMTDANETTDSGPVPGSGGEPSTGGASSSMGGAMTRIAGGTAGLDGGASTGGSSMGGASTGGTMSATGGSPDAGVAGCATGAIRCAGLQPQTCVDGIWLGNGAACSGSTPACLNGACVACDPGSRGCVQNFRFDQPRVCNAAGEWVLEPTCPAATPQCSDGVCGACTTAFSACSNASCPSGYVGCCRANGTCGCASLQGVMGCP